MILWMNLTGFAPSMTPAPSTSYRTQEQVAPPSPALSPNPATPPVCYPLRLAPPPLWPPFPNSPLCYPTPALRLAPPPLWPLFPNPATPPLYRNRHAARKILALLLQKQMQSCSKPKNLLSPRLHRSQPNGL